MAGSIIEISEQRGEQRGIQKGIKQGIALVEMLADEIGDALDFERVERLNRSFISDELRTQESERVFG